MLLLHISPLLFPSVFQYYHSLSFSSTAVFLFRIHSSVTHVNRKSCLSVEKTAVTFSLLHRCMADVLLPLRQEMEKKKKAAKYCNAQIGENVINQKNYSKWAAFFFKQKRLCLQKQKLREVCFIEIFFLCHSLSSCHFWPSVSYNHHHSYLSDVISSFQNPK